MMEVSKALGLRRRSENAVAECPKMKTSGYSWISISQNRLKPMGVISLAPNGRRKSFPYRRDSVLMEWLPRFCSVVDAAILREKERLVGAPQESSQLRSASASLHEPFQWGGQGVGPEANCSQPPFDERGESSQGCRWGQTNGAPSSQQGEGLEANRLQQPFEGRGESSQGYQWGQTNGAQSSQYANSYGNGSPMSFQNLMT